MTLGHWNPSSPDRVGLEFTPDLDSGEQGSVALGSTDALAMGMRSESADSIDSAELVRTVAAPGSDHPRSTGPIAIGVSGGSINATWITEVYAAAGPTAEASYSAWTDYDPNALPEVSVWADELGGTPVFGDIAYGSGIGAYNFLVSSVNGQPYEVEFGTAAASLTGDRIQLRLQVQILESAPAVGTLYFRVLDDASGDWFELGAVGNGEHTMDFPEWNPFTGKPWTQADVRAFDAGYHIAVESYGTDSTGPLLYGMQLSHRSITEDRVAWGIKHDVAAATAEAVTVTLAEPDAAADWSKASATTYLTVVRPAYLGSLNGSGVLYVHDDSENYADRYRVAVLTVPYLHGPTDPGWTGYEIYETGQESRGNLDLVETALSDAGAMFRCVWIDTATDTEDGQPYTRVIEQPVSTGSDLEQEFSSPAAASFDGAEFLIRYATGARPTADLTVEVQRDSDSTVFGTATLSADDIDAASLIGASLWKKVAVELGSVVALVSGTDYNIVFTSSTPDLLPYYLCTLDADTVAGATYDNLSGFAGAEAATEDGVLNTSADVVAWLYDGPAALGSLAGVGGSVASGWTAAASVEAAYCPPGSVPYVAVSWANSSLGADFLQYTLQRRDAVDADWRTIAEITDEADDTIDDYECRVTLPNEYRVRAESVYGSGAWATITDIVVTVASPALMLTSNTDRTQVIAVLDVYGSEATRQYESVEASRAVVMPIHGRDMPVVFLPTERSGVQFTQKVLVDTRPVSGSVPPGPDAYAALRDMAIDPDLPNICVRDSMGNRWWASVLVPSMAPMVLDADMVVLQADIRVIETSVAPAIVAS